MCWRQWRGVRHSRRFGATVCRARAPAVCPLPGITATLRPALSRWPCSTRGTLGARRTGWCQWLCGLGYTRGSLGSFSTTWVSPAETGSYWVLASPRPAKSGLSSPQDPRCLAHFKVWEALGAGTQQSSVQREARVLEGVMSQKEIT